MFEDPEERMNWFRYQRTYPFSSLPSGLRKKVFNSMKKSIPNQLVRESMDEWHPVGPTPTTSRSGKGWGPVSGRINSIAVSPNDSRVILVGTATGGIWMSADAGSSFKAVSDENVDLAVGDIAFSKSKPEIAYAAMGDMVDGYLGTGVMKSLDGGKHWKALNSNTIPSKGLAARILVDPRDSNRIYLAHNTETVGDKIYSTGFYLSTDGGMQWENKFDGITRDLAIDPLNPDTLYLAATVAYSKNVRKAEGVYRSLDCGETWNLWLASPYYSPNHNGKDDEYKTLDIRVSVADAGTIYVYMGGFQAKKFDAHLLVLNNDGGQKWKNLSTSGIDTEQFAYNTCIAVTPDDPETVYVGSRDLFKITKGESEWANITGNYVPDALGEVRYTPEKSALHCDQHVISFDPSNPRIFYIGNDGGLWKSTDAGGSFESLNATLSIGQFESITLHPNDPNIEYGGTKDNGTQRRVNGVEWEEFAQGDGGACVINPQDTTMVFTTYINGEIWRYDKNGDGPGTRITTASTFNETGQKPRIAFFTPLTSNGKDSTLYTGTWKLFVSTDLGLTWSAPDDKKDLTKGIRNNAPPDVLVTIAVAPSNPNVIYTGSRDGRVMVTTDGGKNWKEITGTLPDRSIKSIAIDYNNPATAYLTVSGFLTYHVFKTTNTGATWHRMSANLPDTPANAILIDPTNKNVIYVGTDLGVFRSTNGGKWWDQFNPGMPPVIVNAFSSNKAGAIRAATYGRGVFELIRRS